jgi:hypothetical protein
MKRQVSAETRRQVLQALRARYRGAGREEKNQILNHLAAITGYHRKHAIRLLGGHDHVQGKEPGVGGVPQRIYDQAVLEALILVWEAADRICGKRLKVVIPSFVETMERHGYLRLDPVVREKLLAVSVATIDRLLGPVRAKAKGRGKRRQRPNAALKALIPVRTSADWTGDPPGFCEADLVAHNGGMSAGACVHTLVATDVASGWTECLPLVSRQTELVVEALEVVGAQFPFPLLGLDFDNDGVFMNEGVVEFCRTRDIQLTRSRVYQKNDQAWIEQKNGSVVRRFIGYGRFTGIVAAHTLGRLYQLSRLYVNYFQPSFKLHSKVRHGAKVTKTYLRPATPCDRALASEHVSPEVKKCLKNRRRDLDPVRLLHGIRELQETLSALAKGPGLEQRPTPASQGLELFLAALPRLWQDGEVRPTHRNRPPKQHWWRTRLDPFENVWPKTLGWLQEEPDVTAKDLFERLQKEHPGQFSPGQLRTLQRRVREWRQAIARELVYAGVGNDNP